MWLVAHSDHVTSPCLLANPAADHFLQQRVAGSTRALLPADAAAKSGARRVVVSRSPGESVGLAAHCGFLASHKKERIHSKESSRL